MGEDIAWKLQQAIEDIHEAEAQAMQAQEKAPQPGGFAAYEAKLWTAEKTPDRYATAAQTNHELNRSLYADKFDREQLR